MNWRVSSCCCCCFCYSLRTGTLILGYIGVISNALSALGIVFCKPYVRDLVKASNADFYESLTVEEFEWIITYVHVFLNITLVLCLMSIPFNILLLVGVYKEKPTFIKIYVIIAIIGCILAILGAVFYLIESFSIPQMIGSLIVQLIASALQIYFTMVIHSYRLELIETNELIRDEFNLQKL